MAKTEFSTMPLGLSAPAFTLPDALSHVIRYPQDSPDKMAELAERRGFDFSYGIDKSQTGTRAGTRASVGCSITWKP